jgi:invasion protein IalB
VKLIALSQFRRGRPILVAATLAAFAAPGHSAPALAPASAPAGAAPPASSRPEVTTAAYGDWVVACVGSGVSTRCEGLHGLKNAQGQPAAVLAVGRPATGQPLRLSLRVPVSVSLASSATLTIGADEPISLPFGICIPQGCFADIPLATPAAVARLRDVPAGSVGVVRWKDAGTNNMELAVSFKGLTEVFGRLGLLEK